VPLGWGLPASRGPRPVAGWTLSCTGRPTPNPNPSPNPNGLTLTLYREDRYAFALLYFTGSGDYNRAMRNMAHKLEPTLSLNDSGLYPVDKIKMAGGVEIGESLECPTEQHIFAALGLAYAPPSQRDGDIVTVLPGCGPGWRSLTLTLALLSLVMTETCTLVQCDVCVPA
jgi:hypothetical protein